MRRTSFARRLGVAPVESARRGRLLRVEHLEDRRMLAGRAADAVNAFGFDVFAQMQREQGNLFFSPLSVATSLAMTYAGAAGQTAAEMEQVLHLGSASGIHDAFGQLLDSLNSHSSFSGPLIVSANAIWPRTGAPVQSQFLSTIQSDYGGYVQALDYSNPDAAEDVINSWVANHTLNTIQDLVKDLTPATVMVLTNALYFKALWQNAFDHRWTSLGTFTRGDGTTITTPTMATQLQFGAMTTIDGFRVLEMPFKPGTAGADMSAVFVLPPTRSGEDLSPQVYSQIDAWLDGPQSTTFLQFDLPKFKTEVATNFNDVLAGLGMPSAFDLDTANFSAMMPGQIAIDKVFHKATLEFTEEGTVAAAATQVSLALCLAKGTPVLTPAGEKPIEQLRPGDFVLARDEGNLEGDVRPKRVEAVSSNVGVVLEIHVRGQIIRATANHPFFVKKRGWTTAEEIRAGDLVLTHSSGWLAVDEVKNPNATVNVYNLRVADDRTYFVGSAKWGFAVWVHNDACIPEFDLNREFDVIIRDNATSTILFMGRISDPSQLQNSVSPTFVAPNADFDGNLRVDGQDFLAWQRGSGKLNGAAADSGDADRDGDVDRTDLGYWRAGFRLAYRPPSMVLLPAATTPLSQDQASFDRLSADIRDMALVLNWAVYDSQPDNVQLTDNSQLPEAQLADELFDPTFKDFAAAFSDPSFSPVPGRPATVQGPTSNQTGEAPSGADPTVEWQSLADDELGL